MRTYSRSFTGSGRNSSLSHWHRLLAVLLVTPTLYSKQAWAQTTAQTCPAPVIDPTPEFADLPSPPDDGRIQIWSDAAEVGRNGDAELKGRVRIRQGDRALTAENATFDAESQRFDVSGTVTYRDQDLRIKGDRADISTAGGANFDGAEFELPTIPARGGADRIAVSAEGRLALDGVEYTSCPTGNEDWLLSASDIDINPAAGQGVGRNVRLTFKGIPILYTPFISFPVGNQRKSGFLFPNFVTSSRSGAGASVPWYWNIAPNYDATFTSSWYSQRGFDLLTEFRFLTSNSEGALDAEYLPDDHTYGSDRSLLRFSDQTDFTRRLRLDINAANASDVDWFEDFGEGPEGTSVTYLGRAAQLHYFDRYWTMVGRIQNFQTIDRTIAEPLRPYTLLPQIAVRGELPRTLGFSVALDSEYTYFHRDSVESCSEPLRCHRGNRFDFSPELSLPIIGAAGYVEPAVGWRYTAYDIEHLDTGAKSTPERSAPFATFDTGIAFERLTGSRQQRLLTFEPRLLYVYVPYRDQADLPIFDTTAPDLNLVQLFRTNRYVGADRLGDANQLSVGFTSRLLEADSGREFITGTVGQAFYFDTPRVTLPGEALASTSSDLVAQLEVSAYQDFNVRMGVQWDPDGTRSERGDIHFQYAPAYNKVANLGYRFRRGSVEQWEASAAWPVSDTWSAYARWVYSTEDDTTIERFAGFQYQSCCWKVRIVGREYVSNREGETDTALQIQLELNGLSSVGVAADAFLEQSIRGYSVEPPDVP